MIFNRKVPAFGLVSWVVSHVIRRYPVLLTNDPVCRLSWPDHEPSRCHRVTFFLAGAWREQEQVTARKIQRTRKRREGTGKKEEPLPLPSLPIPLP
jgi:hypothetical protein